MAFITLGFHLQPCSLWAPAHLFSLSLVCPLSCMSQLSKRMRSLTAHSSESSPIAASLWDARSLPLLSAAVSSCAA